MEDEFDVSEEDIAEVFSYLLEAGLMQEVAQTEDGQPLYKFSQELMDMPEFQEVHESITNEILFNIWNKGFIEMNPLNEDGDWNIALCAQSHDMDTAKEKLEEDEFLLFMQIYDELKEQ